MKKTIRQLLACSALLWGASAAQAQGLQGIIVEQFHTVTQADADVINNDIAGSSFAIAPGAKVYRVYVDMAPGYKLASVFGSPIPLGGTASPNPLSIATTTTFWNDDNFGGEVPGQTRRIDEGTMFDSYITVGSTGIVGGTAGCGSATAQLGIRRTLDTNGDLTTCGVYPGFTGNDGSIPGTAPALTYNISGSMDLAAVNADGSSLTVVDDAWATLPNQTGIDPTGTNVLLIGQFTTTGTFSFQLNVALADASNNVETYVHTNAGAGEVVSPFLTYPVAACNPPIFSSFTSNGPLCAGSTLQLNASATGDATIAYSWSGPNNFTSTLQNPTIANATAAATGTYTVTASNGCAPNATNTVNVVVNAPANAGTNGTLTICAGSTVTTSQLFAQLGGTPNAGGTWSPALAGAGVYTYTVTGSAPCANATATVTVSEQAQPNAGTNGTLTICAGSTVTASQLFAQLGGTPNAGGTWSPALAGAGVYTYTVAATAPCTGNATATVTVSAQAQPSAGTNGTLTICAGSTVTASQLFAQLGGTPNAGGTWSPALAGAGVYTYTVAATAPCTGNATATVNVGEQAQPDAGTNGTLSICSTAAAQSLFAQLGGTPDANGTWSGPSTVVNGNYDPATMNAGAYTYTVNATAPCTGNATATVTVTETATGTWYQDTDGDGAGDPNAVLNQCAQPIGYVANNNDLCPTDANKIAPGACGCGVADVAATYYADVDGDGFGDPASPVAGFTCITPNGAVSDNTDNCPATPGLIGDVCNDGNANTINDVIGANCQCAGTLQNEDCEGTPGGTAQPGTPCNDNNPGTGNDTWNANCQCVGLPLDCAGVAGGTALPGTTCNDGNANTGNDVYGSDCVCAGQPLDCLGVPGGSAVVGSSCNDNDPLTTNDVYQANCTCAGTPVTGCTEIVNIAIETDASPAQTSWEIIPEGGGAMVCNGAGNYPANTTITETCCLPVGCYALRVLDSAGDGINTGGYVLTEASTGKRIIDNSDNFTTGSVSAISGQQGFCLPLGDDRLIMTNCDKLDWLPNRLMVATENSAVSATYVNGGANNVQPTNSGYEFWIFDPNGSYSFRRFRNHATSDGYGTGATRACHFQINGWSNSALTPHIPQNVLMNVRIRGRVAGVNAPFGAACRFKVDPARAACPLIQLQDAAGSTFSCGVTKPFANGSKLYAKPPQFIPAVNTTLLRYQFRFRNPGTGATIVRQVNTYQLPLYWTSATAPQLQCGVTYQVDVRVSKDGGATWCIDTPTPNSTYTPWGPVCDVTIAPCAGQASLAQQQSDVNTTFTMYPNPNRGDQLFVSINELGNAVGTVSMDIFDMTGKRISARTLTVQDGFVNQAVDLNGDLAAGLYLVNIIAGDKTFSERLVIQP
ncbi:MAG: T9SS type A sorting domain-containing protein [Flavobacteriales bacterium]|nr:T9SS type A sorting domain-containing protein [Flavobacteriales bacterium]